MDEQQIREFYKKWPDANVAVATGEISGLLALDIDPRNDGSQNLYQLERNNTDLPGTITSETGGGGSHLLFHHVDGVRNQASRIGKGIDVKSNGGYIIVPPSFHATGRRYRWVEGCVPDEIELATCPEWLVPLLRYPQNARDLIPEGRRNCSLAKFAGSLRNQGHCSSDIEDRLQKHNMQFCTPPLESDEVRRIAQSIGRYSVGSAQREDGLEKPLVSAWPPPLSEEAFHGIAGDFVRLVDRHTEADVAALLVQFLVAFGSVIGRKAHFVVGADKHYGNLFAVLVGATSKGRKGTSESIVRSILSRCDELWAKDRITSGLSSGEGLIWHVRDPIETREAIREKGRTTGYQEVITDQGVCDKRLLAVEPEFARVLQVCERETNILSALVRQAWDSGDLRTLTKKDAARATGAHVSIIAHITRDELRRRVSDTAQINGFINRFLWVCVRRSKALPDGGELESVDFSTFQKDLAEAVAFGSKSIQLRRDPRPGNCGTKFTQI